MSANERTASDASPAAGGTCKGAVTIVTQTRVRPESMDAFARWQSETSDTVAQFPGFIKQTVMPPSPPAQADWVILQRFASSEMAVAWLNSEQRLKRIHGAAPMLVGRDDVHIVNDGDAGVLPSPASVVISTRIKPGQELAYRAWEQRIAAAQSKAPGFQGYRFEPPVPGVQDDWLAILRFDTETNLQAWLDSPERQKLLKDANPFTEEFHARIVRTGFDQWFPVPAAGASPPAAWKMNMLVLLLLYPIVFLFGFFVQTPYMIGRGLPFAIALFIGNIVSVVLLSYLVPWMAERFSWWLQPAGPHPQSLTRLSSIASQEIPIRSAFPVPGCFPKTVWEAPGKHPQALADPPSPRPEPTHQRPALHQGVAWELPTNRPFYGRLIGSFTAPYEPVDAACNQESWKPSGHNRARGAFESISVRMVTSAWIGVSKRWQAQCCEKKGCKKKHFHGGPLIKSHPSTSTYSSPFYRPEDVCLLSNSKCE